MSCRSNGTHPILHVYSWQIAELALINNHLLTLIMISWCVETGLQINSLPETFSFIFSHVLPGTQQSLLHLLSVSSTHPTELAIGCHGILTTWVCYTNKRLNGLYLINRDDFFFSYLTDFSYFMLWKILQNLLESAWNDGKWHFCETNPPLFQLFYACFSYFYQRSKSSLDKELVCNSVFFLVNTCACIPVKF